MSASLPQIFIDGHVGTTGLQLAERLRRRDDLIVKSLPERFRKDPSARTAAASESQIAVLCLPEEAARHAATMYAQTGAKLLDTSCAHRVSHGWVYGLPELHEFQPRAIAESTRVTNPGCYALASILSVRPLIEKGLLDSDVPLSINALSGYSGGGTSMIEEHEAAVTVRLAPRPYALTRRHKHLEEIRSYAGLDSDPVFIPSVAGFRQGMRLWIPLHQANIRSDSPYEDVLGALAERYAWEPRVRVTGHHGPREVASLDLEPALAAGSDRIWLHVIHQAAGHVLLIAVLDNLGKGAAGTAEQNIELMLGLAPTSGRQIRAKGWSSQGGLQLSKGSA